MMANVLEDLIVAVHRFQRELDVLPSDAKQLAWDLAMIRTVGRGTIFRDDNQTSFYFRYMQTQDTVRKVKYNVNQLCHYLSSNVYHMNDVDTELFARSLLCLPNVLAEFQKECLPQALMRECDLLTECVRSAARHFLAYHAECQQARDAQAKSEPTDQNESEPSSSEG